MERSGPRVKSEALECTDSATYAYLSATCPYCKKNNNIFLGNLDDDTVPDIEAIKCWSCNNKFWAPGHKHICETNAGIGWDDPEEVATCEELGIEPGTDLIETAYDEEGTEK